MAMLLSFLPMSAADFEVDGLYYAITSLDKLECELVRGDNSYTGTITIPSEVTYKNKVLKVIGFSRDAFDGSSINSVYLPNGFTLPESAFANCASLQYVSLPSDLVEIPTTAFSGCRELKTISIPETVLNISSGAFYGCVSLGNIELPSKLQYMGACCFYETGLSELRIPSSLEYIGRYALAACRELKQVEFGEECRFELPDHLFSDDVNLVQLLLPDNLTVIPNGTFYGCSSLKSVRIPNSCKVIDTEAFYNCISLEDLRLPDGLTTINSSAFSGCENLCSIDFPETLTIIGSYAFWNTQISNFNLPDSLVKYSPTSFYTKSVNSIVIGGGINELPYEVNGRGSYKKGSDGQGCEQISTIDIYDLYGWRTKSFYMCISRPSSGHEDGKVVLWDSSQHPNYFNKSCNPLKSIVIKDNLREFDIVEGFIDGRGTDDPLNYTPVNINSSLSYLYIGRPIVDSRVKACDLGFNVGYYNGLKAFVSIKKSPRSLYPSIEKLEIGGFCNEVPYLNFKVETLLLGSNVIELNVDNVNVESLRQIRLDCDTPPAIIGTFQTSTYLDTEVIVPYGTLDSYMDDVEWKKFWNIKEGSYNSGPPESVFVDMCVSDESIKREIIRYDLNGNSVNDDYKGLVIVRYSDGSSRKLIQKQ